MSKKYFKAGMYFYNQVETTIKGKPYKGDDLFFCEYRFNTDKERTDALKSIHNKLFESRFSGELAHKYERINPNQIIKNFLITEYEPGKTGKEIYNTSALRMTLHRLQLLQKEAAFHDTKIASFIEACRFEMQHQGRLNSDDMKTLLTITERKIFGGIKFNRLFLEKRIANINHPKVEHREPKAALTRSEIVGKELIKANTFQEVLQIADRLLNEGFEEELIQGHTKATIEALFQVN